MNFKNEDLLNYAQIEEIIINDSPNDRAEIICNKLNKYCFTNKGELYKFNSLDVVYKKVETTIDEELITVISKYISESIKNLNKEQKLWQNWFDSNIPWILITHNLEVSENFDFEYGEQLFPFSSANWNLSPWNFPAPADLVSEYGPNDRSMGLWHRDQFKGIL
jgi:hypothetical protein